MHAYSFGKAFFLVSDTNESATCRLQKKQKTLRFYKFKKEKHLTKGKLLYIFINHACMHMSFGKAFFLVSDTNESATCRLQKKQKTLYKFKKEKHLTRRKTSIYFYKLYRCMHIFLEKLFFGFRHKRERELSFAKNKEKFQTRTRPVVCRRT